MPKRPRQHQLEDESRVAFQRFLPSRFVFRPQSSDYGIDGEVEEFDEQGSSTGLRYLIQLKGTGIEDVDRALALSLEQQKAAYYRSLALPVLMVRYLSHGERVFGRWFHNPLGLPSGGDKYRTFKWSVDDELGPDDAERLAQEARRFLHMRSSRLPLPQSFALELHQNVTGVSPAELDIALRQATRERPDTVRFADSGRADGVIRIGGDLVVIELGGGRSASIS